MTDKIHVYSVKKFRKRKYSEEGAVKFQRLMWQADWDTLDGLDPDTAVTKMNQIFEDMNDACFPYVEHTIRSCDKPWITRRIKRLIRRKKRAFKRGGKNNEFKRKRDKTDQEILMNKVRFFSKVKDKMLQTRNTRDYYAAIKLLQTEETASRWEITSLFPDLSDMEIATRAADFFNRISREFEPLDPPLPEDLSHLAPSVNTITKKIKDMKKPRSQVEGDLDRRIIMRYPGLVALPLQKIFKSIYSRVTWPTQWKKETVTLLPKNKAPESFAQMRNISCTPFFSKVLESILLDDLRQDIKLSCRQYGGLKGQGVNHMLVEIWEEIHASLENRGAAVNLMAIDFEKAFNRMEHRNCLNSLRNLNGKESTIKLVHAFLYGRSMSVKINSSLSPPLGMPGGAPQGSILACFLFCASIDRMLSITPDNLDPPGQQNPGERLTGNTSTRPTDSSSSSSDEETDDEDIRTFHRWFKPRVLEDSVLSTRAPQEEIDNELGVPSDWQPRPARIQGYIDDVNVVECVRESDAITHFTEYKPEKFIHAPASENMFKKMGRHAADIGMVVNPLKTQVLCISSSSTHYSTSYIRHEETRISSGEHLKILGFHFDKRPSVALHVEKMLEKLRNRLWTLRHMRASGLSQNDLLGIYCGFLRPIIDFAVPTYHSQLTLEQTAEIERIQADSMRIIYGPLIAYSTILEHRIIEEHRARRARMVLKFAEKAECNENFCHAWFPTNPPVDYQIRQRNKYALPNYKTERYKKSPIQHYKRILNEKHRK